MPSTLVNLVHDFVVDPCNNSIKKSNAITSIVQVKKNKPGYFDIPQLPSEGPKIESQAVWLYPGGVVLSQSASGLWSTVGGTFQTLQQYTLKCFGGTLEKTCREYNMGSYTGLKLIISRI
jgi:hypothetical protein